MPGRAWKADPRTFPADSRLVPRLDPSSTLTRQHKVQPRQSNIVAFPDPMTCYPSFRSSARRGFCPVSNNTQVLSNVFMRLVFNRGIMLQKCAIDPISIEQPRLFL